MALVCQRRPFSCDSFPSRFGSNCLFRSSPALFMVSGTSSCLTLSPSACAHLVAPFRKARGKSEGPCGAKGLDAAPAGAFGSGSVKEPFGFAHRPRLNCFRGSEAHWARRLLAGLSHRARARISETVAGLWGTAGLKAVNRDKRALLLASSFGAARPRAGARERVLPRHGPTAHLRAADSAAF